MQFLATLKLNDSKLLAGHHTSSISTLMTNSRFNIELTKYERYLCTQKERHHAAFAVEKYDTVDLVSKAWDESFAHINTNKNVVAEQGWVH